MVNTGIIQSLINAFMDELNDRLLTLYAIACRHPDNSSQRRKALTQMIRLITQSGRLSKKSSQYYDPSYYEDALQQTRLHLCQNLCRLYDPNKASILTWLNAYLDYRLRDFYLENQRRRATTISSSVSDLDKDPIANIPAPANVPSMLEEVRKWAETDPDLGRIYIENYPQVTGRVLILKRLPPETTWEKLAREFGITIATLSGFYKRKCKPRLKRFLESEGYL